MDLVDLALSFRHCWTHHCGLLRRAISKFLLDGKVDYLLLWLCIWPRLEEIVLLHEPASSEGGSVDEEGCGDRLGFLLAFLCCNARRQDRL